ncbi:MAG: PEP-CTERM sorting domain-containing protein [Verrucomicrobiaceae bacterium]|nr:MAG: PEP-CTERM sorting domain-containing protein [Verrucomicrobiaceae bacterium]
MRIPFLSPSLLLAAAVLTAAPSAVRADEISLNISMGYLYDAVGTAQGNRLDSDTLFMLVADLGNDGFDPVPSDSWVGGTDVAVMIYDTEFPSSSGGAFGFDLSAGDSEDGLFSRTLVVDLAQFAGFSGALNFSLRWFPGFKGDTGLPATGPGAGQAYGEFSRSTSQYGLDSWKVNLAPGASYSLDPLATAELGGTDLPAAGMANLVTIPEPGTTGMLLMGMAAVSMRRKRIFLA